MNLFIYINNIHIIYNISESLNVFKETLMEINKKKDFKDGIISYIYLRGVMLSLKYNLNEVYLLVNNQKYLINEFFDANFIRREYLFFIKKNNLKKKHDPSDYILEKTIRSLVVKSILFKIYIKYNISFHIIREDRDYQIKHSNHINDKKLSFRSLNQLIKKNKLTNNLSCREFIEKTADIIYEEFK